MNSRKLAIAAAIGLMGVSAQQAFAADNTYFDNFTALAGNVAAGSLPESAPLQLSSPFFSQKVLADRVTQLANGESNSGNWDMITANETASMPVATSTHRSKPAPAACSARTSGPA
jgi:hypothetical protein